MTSATGGGPLPLADPDDRHDRREWEAAAAAVLRKARRLGPDDADDSVWDALATTTADGIRVRPLGTAADVADLPPTGAPGEFPYTRGRFATRPDGWDVRSHVGGLDAAAANREALLDLENGVTSLWLHVGGPLAAGDLPRALEGVLLDLAPVVLDAPDDAVGAAQALVDLLDSRATTPASGTGLGGDPVSAALRRGEPDLGGGRDIDPAAVADEVTALAGIARGRGLLALTVDATVVHDAGGTDAQELGYALALGAHYLRALVDGGHHVDDALAQLEFRFAATDEQLTTIAKLRAARRTWARVAQLSGASPQASAQRQHAVTSRAMTSTRDPWVNMLRGTVAAFSAGVAGVDALTVLPFDAPAGRPEALGRRTARNTSALLLSESHVGVVADPAGGSYAVESLTDAIARAAWAELDRTESAGGVLAALSDGSLARRVGEAAARRDVEVAHRRRPLTGLSEFPDAAETPLQREPDASAPPVRRWGAAFERLRETPATHPVLLATMGPVAAHTARATFAQNLFAAGGVPVRVVGATTGVDDLVAAWSGENVVCLCGSDAAYAEWGAAAAAALRGAGATRVVLAGRPGPRTLDPSLVDDAAAVGDDAVAFLTRTREALS